MLEEEHTGYGLLQQNETRVNAVSTDSVNFPMCKEVH